MAVSFGSMGKLLKQLQRVQEDMARLQAELAQKDFEATAGGGAVRAVVSGRLELKSLQVAPEVVDPGDVEMLQDLVVAAVNGALRKAQEAMAQEMARLTGGLNLPAPGLPF